MTDRAQETLVWASKLMPTEAAKTALMKVYRESPRSTEMELDRLVVRLAGCVTDGLRYGNWVGHTHEECQDLADKKRRERAKEVV